MKKIAIIGLPGSGKSTFALKLSKRLEIPLFHLDKYFFVADWKERPSEEFLQMQEKLVQEDSWIIDGNALQSLEVRFAKADAVLYFRLPRLLCLWRIFKRRLSKDPHISDRAEGCPETVRFRLICYLWGFDRRVRPLLEKLQEKYPAVPFVECKSDQQIEAWLQHQAL